MIESKNFGAHIPEIIQIARAESRQNSFFIYSAYIEATEMCNTAMERVFCKLFGNIFINCEKLSYETKWALFWQVVEFANKPITN